MEEYKKTPSYLMTSDNKRIINKLSYQITQGIEESIKAANKYYKAAIKDKNFAKGVKYVNNLLENIEKGAKTKKYFRKELETLKALKKILEKAEKKIRKENYKRKKIEIRNSIQNLMKKSILIIKNANMQKRSKN